MIRRKASGVPSVKQAEERAQKEIERLKEIEEQKKAEDQQQEASDKTEGTPQKSPKVGVKKNIVGKIDLSRVKKVVKQGAKPEKKTGYRNFPSANIPSQTNIATHDKRKDTKKTIHIC